MLNEIFWQKEQILWFCLNKIFSQKKKKRYLVKFTEMENRMMVPRSWGTEEWQIKCLMGTKFSVWDD